MAGTCTGILGELVEWSINLNTPHIFWLAGMAGAARSAVAWAFCELLKANSGLGGSFFCLRGSVDRGEIARILPSLRDISLDRMPFMMLCC